MKRKVFLFGGSGGRMLEALLFMAFAGITPEETLDLVLCDPDGDGMHGAVQLRQELADYQRIWASRTYIGTGNPAFQTEINLRTWCDPLPMNAKTLADWTQDEKQDALLCQALFPADTASLDLRQGFHDHPELARVAFAAMLSAKDRAILGHTYGVFGYEKLSADELGLREMLSPDGVTKARKAALERLRSRYPGSGLHLWRDVYHALKDISDI